MLPYQIVCEGKADEVFFSQLLRNSGKQADVRCPKPREEGYGITAIRNVLVGMQSQFDKIERVLVVIDSDDSPQQAFQAGCTEFTRANEQNPAKPYPIPMTVNTLMAGNPSTAIVLVPASDRQGCLDTLLLPSFRDRYPAAIQCADAFYTCLAQTNLFSEKQQSKIILRALIAASENNPGASLANLLEEGHCRIAMNHASFGDIRDTLTSLLP